MNIKLIEISEYDFKRLDFPVLFSDNLADRNFGVLSNDKYKYKLGWQSENVKPVVQFIDKELYSIGIDLLFIIFEITTGKVLKKILLEHFFYDIRVYNNSIYVMTELEIIKINIEDLLIIATYSLSDYFESIEFSEEIIVRCIDGEEITLE